MLQYGKRRVCIDIFKSTLGCVWKTKSTTLQSILSSPPFVPELCLLNSSPWFNPQILSQIPYCLHCVYTLACQQTPGYAKLEQGRWQGAARGADAGILHVKIGESTPSKELGRRALSTSSLGRDHWIHLSVMRDLKMQGSTETCRLYFIWDLGSTVAQGWRCFMQGLLPNTSHWLEDTGSPYPCN